VESLSLADWLALLETRHPKAIDLGLDRCREVWKRMGSPQPAPQTYLVAGTNGKGSTVATICALLGALNYCFGSYTSPHLIRFNERVRLNGREVSDVALVRAFERVEAARGGVSLTYFEFSTLAAFSILSQANLDFAVLEIGLGGRLDAVNLLDADCAVITPVGYDHQEYLGGDLESIGREKAGIIRPGRPVVCGEPDPPASILQCAAERQAPLIRRGVDFQVENQGDTFRFRMDGMELNLPMPALAGWHQLENAATALAALLQLLPAACEEQAALSKGLSSVVLHGRLERVLQRPAVWIDVGHNALAARAVALALQEIMAAEGIRRCRCVLGMLADKDVPAVAAELDALVSDWYCAGLQGDRGQTGERLAGRLQEAGLSSSIRAFNGVSQAMDAALAESDPEDGLLLFGSFLTASEAAMSLRAQAATTSPG